MKRRTIALVIAGIAAVAIVHNANVKDESDKSPEVNTFDYFPEYSINLLVVTFGICKQLPTDKSHECLNATDGPPIGNSQRKAFDYAMSLATTDTKDSAEEIYRRIVKDYRKYEYDYQLYDHTMTQDVIKSSNKTCATYGTHCN